MAAGLLDFLYHDARRVGSLLSQLNEAGLLTSVCQSVGSETAGEIKVEGKAAGKIPLVAKAEGGGGVSGRHSKVGQLERTFDPFWRNAREFVTYSQDAARSVEDAQIGQIVQLTGEVTIIDFEFLKNFMANKSIMESMLQGTGEQDGNRQQRRANKAKGRQNTEPPMADIFGLFPYKIQMTVEGIAKGWSTLSEEFLVTEASDLVLKYGRALDGKWTVIGILDAAPHTFSGDLIGTMDIDAGVEAFGMKITNAMAPMARVLLGRPSDAYGITPLVVYREIS